MLSWILILWSTLPCCYHAAAEGVYECGAHGRFEYCIDGIPGCVIGCHCHPGYYFDTEAKICEPNTKLTQNYRRRMPPPTRVQETNYLPDETEMETLPTYTTQNVLDEHVNDIAKNADDLGDWLYNQFFKTIENQVINNTDKDGSLTRRSGRDSHSKHKKPKRRAGKGKKSKHKQKMKGVRGKLLRIAEDDSLFKVSDSEADEDSSDSDSTSNDSSDSDDDHGHKKILMIKKKPKVPLPSFIFLPHMDTPFYPPIGLPPPPVMPMYPPVPVPPVMPPPPFMPYPAPLIECEEDTTVATTTTVASTTTETETSSSASSDEHTTETSARVRAGRHRKDKKKGKTKPFENIPDVEDLPSDYFTPPPEPRQKFLQRLRDRMNTSPLNKNRKPSNSYNNQQTPPDMLISNNNLEDMVFKGEPLDMLNDVPDQENVDFKYLSQLIHRSNESQARNAQLESYNPNNPLRKKKLPDPRDWPQKKYHVYNFPLDSRRLNQQNIATKNGQPDDSYYSKLGRQIATLIRTIDTDNERQLSLEIEKVQENLNEKPFFSDNAPRTFWERSVRSPLPLNTNHFYPLEYSYDTLKKSNELLYNIENKVETVVSTAPTLSLQDIENMINVMKLAEAQSRNHANINNVKPSSQTVNINSWPPGMKQSGNSIKNFARPNVFDINRKKFINYSNDTRPEIVNTNIINLGLQGHRSFTDQVDYHNLPDSKYELQIQPLVKTTNTKMYFVKNITEKMYPQTVQKPKPSVVHYTKNLQYRHPASRNNNNVKKYFFDDVNHYSFQNDNTPFRYSISNANSNQPVHSSLPSPYFHHEIKHVDYTP